MVSAATSHAYVRFPQEASAVTAGAKWSTAGAALTQDLSYTAPGPARSCGASHGFSACQSDDYSDDACSSGCSSGNCDFDKVVAVRRYCIIFSEDVPEEYFTNGTAVADIDAVVSQAVAELQAAGMTLVDHEYACGVDAYNVKAEDGEMWCNIPETCVGAVADTLGDKVEDLFEEGGFDFDE